MATKAIEVTDRTGMRFPAKLLLCEVCGGETWTIYDVGEHTHYQCLTCGESHCDGTCIDDN